MRLIDADALIKCLNESPNYDLARLDKELRRIIDSQPTAFDAEAVVQQLEQDALNGVDLSTNGAGHRCRVTKERCAFCYMVIGKAIDRIRNGGKNEV